MKKKILLAMLAAAAMASTSLTASSMRIGVCKISYSGNVFSFLMRERNSDRGLYESSKNGICVNFSINRMMDFVEGRLNDGESVVVDFSMASGYTTAAEGAEYADGASVIQKMKDELSTLEGSELSVNDAKRFFLITSSTSEDADEESTEETSSTCE